MSIRLVSTGAAGLAAMLLAGCLSIPISTLYKLSTMSDEDVLAMNPAELRAAVELPDDVPVDPKKIVVGFCFVKDDNDPVGIGGRWPVQQIASGRYVAAGLPTAPVGRTQYLFRASDEAQAKLNTILATARADRKAYGKAKIDIRLDAGDAPAAIKSYRTSGWFLISPRQGYLKLLDDYTVDLEALRKDGKKPDPADAVPFAQHAGCR